MQFKVMADAGYYDPGDLTDLEMQPGEFILFNERTLHHSEANHSDRRRIGLAVRAIIPIVKVLEYNSPAMPCRSSTAATRWASIGSRRRRPHDLSAEPSASASPAIGRSAEEFTR